MDFYIYCTLNSWNW